MLNSKKKFIIIALLAVVCTGVKAQNMNPSNNGSTPYSRYGYGRLAETSFVRNRAMGGIGYGLRTNQQTNTMNPASYTAIDSLTFLFDFALNAQIDKYKEYGLSESKWDGGLDYLAMQFPIGKYFSASLGLLPYSYVGYSYGVSDSLAVEGSADDTKIAYTQAYAGNGGLNKVYLGFGAEPFKGISVGVNVGYIFGEIANDWAVVFPNAGISSTSANRKISARALELEFGVQLNRTFNEKHEVTVGGVFAPKMNMRLDATNITTTAFSDTVSSDQTVNIPMKYGVGFTYVYDKRLTVGADYSMEAWGDVYGLNDNLERQKNMYKDRSKFAIGGEYIPSLINRNYFQRMRYRLGAHYSESYIDVKVNPNDPGSRNKEFGMTVGLGFPLKGQKSLINVAFEYIDVKPQNKTYLSESYFQFNVGLTFNEFWFFKNKIK